MTAAARTDVRELLARAAADGVHAVVREGRVYLRGNADALPRWAEALRPHREAVIDHLRAAANDPALTRPLQPRPAVLRLPQHPGDPQEEALALLDQLHAWGVILTAEHGELRAHGLHTLPAELREEVSILLLPEVMGRDLLAAVQARDAAAAAIERAMPLQRCWGCAHLRTFDAHRGHAPQCQRGHAVAWRELNPGRRITPLRIDQRGPCADRDECGDNDTPNT